MSRLLYRLGGAAAAHPWRTVTGALVVLAVAIGLSLTVGGSTHDDYRIDGTKSQRAADFLEYHFGSIYAADARVVVHTASGTLNQDDLGAAADRLRQLPHVSMVEPARLSADGDTALIGVQYDVPVTEFSGSEGVDALWSAVADLQATGVQVELGGQVPENFAPPSGTAELVGVLIALFILLFAFGSVVAAGLPLAVALVGLGVGSSLITVLAAVTDVSTTAPTVASMVGIGVGIDYALLLVTRYCEELRAGFGVQEAAARANGTAGVSVVFAGTTVLVSLLGLRLAGLPVYTSVGLATLLVVLAVMLASITLVPALCAVAGVRVLRRADRQALINSALTGTAATDSAGRSRITAKGPTATARWAQRIGRNPKPWAIGALILLLMLATPLLSMRTFPQNAGSQPESSTTRRAYDLVAAEFGAGANGPLLLGVDLWGIPEDDLPALARRLSDIRGIAGISPPIISPDGHAALIVVQPTTGPQDERTAALLERLRDEQPRTVRVTGLTATYVDIADRLAQQLWIVIAFVVGVSLVLLTAVFRSVVIAVKAATMNLLSVAAAYGVMVAVFQWGWGAELLGLPHAVPISTWVPVLMFAILFGLSMDYQVFLLSRIREDYLATGDPRGSVVRGLAATGRVITCAAAIMVAVFVGFGLDADPVVKMMGVGMAAAVLIDATVVRMVLVPATMSLLGRANWWLPGWLDRLLPRFDVEGHLPVAAGRDSRREGSDGGRFAETANR